MVVDIGGGSTEVAFGGQRITSSLSVNAGAVYLTELFLKHDPPTAEELRALNAVLQDTWSSQPNLTEATRSSAVLVSLGGTVVNLVSVKLGLNRFDSEWLHCAVSDRTEIVRQI